MSSIPMLARSHEIRARMTGEQSEQRTGQKGNVAKVLLSISQAVRTDTRDPQAVRLRTRKKKRKKNISSKNQINMWALSH